MMKRNFGTSICQTNVDKIQLNKLNGILLNVLTFQVSIRHTLIPSTNNRIQNHCFFL